MDGASKSHIYLPWPGVFWIPGAHFHVDIVQELQTCSPLKQNLRLLSWICPLSRPGSSLWHTVQHNSMSCWFLSSHLSPSPSCCPCPCPSVPFLCYSKSLLTALVKSRLPPSTLWTAARKGFKHKSDHITICFKACNGNPLLKINVFH